MVVASIYIVVFLLIRISWSFAHIKEKDGFSKGELEFHRRRIRKYDLIFGLIFISVIGVYLLTRFVV